MSKIMESAQRVINFKDSEFSVRFAVMQAFKVEVTRMEAELVYWKEARQAAIAEGELMLTELKELRAKLAALEAELAEAQQELSGVTELRDECNYLRAKLAAIETDRDEWKDATISANERFKTAEAKLAALAALEKQEPVLWWNGIRNSVTDRDGDPHLSTSPTENTWHDIPLMAVTNPANLSAGSHPRVPMTEAESRLMLDKLGAQHEGDEPNVWDRAIVIATEAHHNIGAKE